MKRYLLKNEDKSITVIDPNGYYKVDNLEKCLDYTKYPIDKADVDFDGNYSSCVDVLDGNQCDYEDFKCNSHFIIAYECEPPRRYADSEYHYYIESSIMIDENQVLRILKYFTHADVRPNDSREWYQGEYTLKPTGTIQDGKSDSWRFTNIIPYLD